MREIKKLLCLLLALCALLALLPAALAEEPDPEDERFADKTWDEVVEEFLKNKGTNPKNVGIGYYNTVTGEEHYVNADEYRITASMYKVALNMVFLDRLSRGEMDWDTNVSGYRYEDVLEQTIVRSNNDIARNMVKWELGNGNWQEGRRKMAPYCGEDPATVSWTFLENNNSTPRQIITCLRMLYENPDRFPRLIETMQRAEPTEYFKRREQRFNIAHKYGFLITDYHQYINDCGICYTDDPILIVLFTDNLHNAYDVLTEFCTLMCDYAQYHHAERLRLEAEEAERLEAERQEAERLEAERLRAEQEKAQQLPAATQEPQAPEPLGEATGVPTDSPAPESEPPAAAVETETPAPTAFAEESPAAATAAPVTEIPATAAPAAPTAAPDQGESPLLQPLIDLAGQYGLSKSALYALGGVLLALVIALILLASLSRVFRVRNGFFVFLAVLLCLAAVGGILWPLYQDYQDNKPSGDPQETVRSFFEALRREDYPAAYACLDRVETLGLEYIPQRESGRAIRQAMLEQFSAELYGSCSINGELAYQQVSCRYFDVTKLDSDARSEAMRLLSSYSSTHSLSDLYNEDGRYRPELLRQYWDQAAMTLLQQPENYRSSGGAQLELRWRDGAWRIEPTEKLLQMLTGGMKLTERGGEE